MDLGLQLTTGVKMRLGLNTIQQAGGYACCQQTIKNRNIHDKQ